MKSIFKSLLFLFVSFFLLFNFVLAEETQTINNKTFTKQDVFWVDNDFQETTDCLYIKHNSQGYSMLIEHNKEINNYTALGNNIKIKINEQNIVIADDAYFNARTAEVAKKTKINNSTKPASANTNHYALAIVIILGIFLIALIVVMLVSRRHKKQENSQ
ncbi:MAG: hypothetical protein V1898_04805 [Patescibacteria group bacterium]